MLRQTSKTSVDSGGYNSRVAPTEFWLKDQSARLRKSGAVSAPQVGVSMPKLEAKNVFSIGILAAKEQREKGPPLALGTPLAMGTPSGMDTRNIFSVPQKQDPMDFRSDLSQSMIPATRGSSDKKKVSQCANNWICVKSIFWHPFSILLIFMPVGIWAGIYKWSAGWLFTLNFVALIPLAKILGDFTEELQSALSNEVISGLVSATLGNAVEMIVTIQMLRKGNTAIVKEALIGSVLSNMLLVLGTAFFAGGLSRSGAKRSSALASVSEESGTEESGAWLPQDKEQQFQNLGTLVNMTMLLVSSMSFALPTVFSYTTLSVMSEEMHLTLMLRFSRIIAAIVFSSYLAYLFFALYTHKQLLADAEEEDDEDEDRPTMSAWLIIVLISLVTFTITVLSDFLCNSIKGVTAESMTSSFVGVILLPIVGNACEHAAAIRFAIQDMPGLAVSIAVGSSSQIALFVVPFAVLAGWSIDVDMDLGFGAMNTIVMTLSVVIVLTVVTDGRANWLEGYMLVTAYAIIAVMYWFLPDKALSW